MRGLSSFVVLAFGLLLIGASPPVAGASTGKRAADRFERMLSAIDIVPSRSALDRQWPDAHKRLIQAATNDKRRGYTRNRAISLLSFFPAAGTRKTLRALCSHAAPEVRRIAVYTLGRTFGVPGTAALVKRIATATRDPQSDVRVFAVRALRWVRHPSAQRLLEALTRQRGDKSLRQLAARTLQRRNRK